MYVCVCIYIYIYIYMCVCVYVCVYVYIHKITIGITKKVSFVKLANGFENESETYVTWTVI